MTNQSFINEWKQILHLILGYDAHKELLNDLLGNISSNDPGIRFKSLKRLSFVIFSGDKNQFHDEYFNILTKVLEGLRDAVFVDLISEYFTLLRVIFLKFSLLNDPTKEAAKELQVFWPQLTFKLDQIFENSNEVGVLQAALKLIEAISALNIEDHTLIQWMFVPDCNLNKNLLLISNWIGGNPKRGDKRK